MVRSASVAGDELSAEALLRQRVVTEEQYNQQWLGKVVSGESKETLKYGGYCQLQHLKTGNFLAVKEEAAPFDPDCRALTLEAGSSAAVFKLAPRFKSQAEGSSVYYGHSLVLEAGRHRGTFVHVSPVVYDDIPDATDPSLPRCLQTGVTFEANASSQPCHLSVHKVGRFEESEAGFLRTGRAFRLYHSHSEAFFHVIIGSFQLVFSSIRSAQDIFKLMPAATE